MPTLIRTEKKSKAVQAKCKLFGLFVAFHEFTVVDFQSQWPALNPEIECF